MADSTQEALTCRPSGIVLTEVLESALHFNERRLAHFLLRSAELVLDHFYISGRLL